MTLYDQLSTLENPDSLIWRVGNGKRTTLKKAISCAKRVNTRYGSSHIELSYHDGHAYGVADLVGEKIFI